MKSRIFISSVQKEFADRLKVSNPGGINPALTKNDLFQEHSSFPNNPILADSLFYTRHIEKIGSGITDLIRDCRDAGLQDPEIEVLPSEFRITIFRKNKGRINENKSDENVGSAVLIARKLLVDANLSIKKISESLKITEKETRLIIDKLHAHDLVTRVGSKKNGKLVLASWAAEILVDPSVVLSGSVDKFIEQLYARRPV